MLDPVPAIVPPQDAVYQFHVAPVPKEPPLTVKVTEDPKQTEDKLLIAVAGLLVSVTVTAKLAHIVLLQVPSALTKYVVLADGDTVTEVPEPTLVPPQEPLYHFHVAPAPSVPPETLSVVEVPKHIVEVPEMEVAGLEVSCTVIEVEIQAVELHVPSALR